MNWSEILKRGGVPEPPGRQEALRLALERSRVKAVKPKAKPKNKSKRKR
tara:strand:+ start:100 stop:246 length:147 start_codon:yes stop_codon:yes gene_type:complete